MNKLLQPMMPLAVAMSFALTAVAKDITLAWDASPSADVVRYVVSMGTEDGGPYPQQWNVLAHAGTTLAIPGLAPGRHYFVVQAVNSSNLWSDFSNQLEVIIPEPPQLTVVEPPSLLLTGVVYRATNALGPWKEQVRLPPVAVPANSGDGFYRLGMEWGRFNGN